MKSLDLYPDMNKTTETQSLCQYRRNLVHSVLQTICDFLCGVFRTVIHHCRSVTDLLNIKLLLSTREKVVMMSRNNTPEVKDWSEHKTWNTEIKMATIFDKTFNSQMKAMMIQSDQMAVADILLSDWLECQSEEEGESKNDSESEWSEEEDEIDEGVSQMSSENRELWESFLNNSDPYNPFHFTCSNEDKVKAHDDEPVPLCPHMKDETEWSEEEDSDWLDEGNSEMSAQSRKLWESFNSDAYNPLCFSCPTGVKTKASEIKQNHTPSSSTPRKVKQQNPEQHTKEGAKKVVALHHVFYCM